MEGRPNPGSHRRPLVQLTAGLARLRRCAPVLGDLRSDGTARVRLLYPQSSPSKIFLWLLVSLAAGFCEELVFRGYLQRQFHAATGSIAAAVALPAIVFGLVHTYQG